MVSKLIKFFIGLPLSLIAIFFIAKLFLNQKQQLLSLIHINAFTLVISISLFLAYFFLRSFFWQKLLSLHNVSLSFKESSFIWGMSELKRYVPGNIWSFISRTTQHHEKGHSKKIIVKGLLQEIATIIIASLIVSLCSLNFLVFGFLPHFPLQFLLPFIIPISVGILVLCIIFHQYFFPKKPKIIQNFFPSRNPWIMFQLLCVMTCGFLAFGLATFFAVYSLSSLYLPHIFSLAGFFVFALLVGYLSFITPMGLGVREAIITTGLARYMSLASAALGAIFARLIFIVSELIFLAICFLWIYIKNSWVTKIERFFAEYKYEIALAFAVGVYIFYFTFVSFLRYQNFYTGRFDLGNMDQTVWNTIHGRFFQLTNPDGIKITTRLAFHADYMLALLAPFYWIWQDPRMLLLIQSIALGIGGFFVYAISQKILHKKSLSFIFAFSYLTYPAINHANIFDFHAVTIAVPLLLASWYFLMKKNYVITILLLLLAGTTKEEVWLIVGLFGLWIALIEKQKIVGSVLAIFSFGFFYYLFWHAIPTARGSQHFALSYYSDFGSNPTDVMKNFFLNPGKTIATLFGNGRPRYVLEVFAPTAFFAFFAFPYLIFAVPDLLLDLLSQNAQLHSIHYHYASILTPFVFIASMYGVRFCLKNYKKLSLQMTQFLLILSAIMCAYFYGPLPGAISMNHDMFTHPLTHAKQIDEFLQSIPHKYSVAATNNVGSHLSHRQRIYTIPTGVDTADIIVMLLNDQYAQPSLKAQKQLAEDLKHDKRYVVLIEINDFIVFKKISIPTEFRHPRNMFLPIFQGK